MDTPDIPNVDESLADELQRILTQAYIRIVEKHYPADRGSPKWVAMETVRLDILTTMHRVDWARQWIESARQASSEQSSASE